MRPKARLPKSIPVLCMVTSSFCAAAMTIAVMLSLTAPQAPPGPDMADFFLMPQPIIAVLRRSQATAQPAPWAGTPL